MTVELRSKPGCVACTATKRSFESKGIEYTVRDVTEDPEAFQLVKDLGYTGMPVVVVDGGADHWSGLRLDKIDSLVA